ncbi:choice-of-anchor U domain-containing protein [Synechococcus sp. CS-1328]|uniref:choice-of-anchor U domain-containing protein n=1 Tax=Synechococcus sp. CS-1328 TaxID=2847976 RepID=UPI00223B97B2|nr:choice-of-anchor U domain-containing protein [Synechococcus sp. CS-1328]MCT0223693.1 hypothetical protein [Synechococcus sp. CS-1328]
MARFEPLNDSIPVGDPGFVVADAGLVISEASVLQVLGAEQVVVTAPDGSQRSALPPTGIDELLDGYIQYVVSGLQPGASTVVSFFLPDSLQVEGVNGNALVKFNVQSGLFEDYLDLDGSPLYSLIDSNADGITDRIDIVLRDGDPRWDGDGLANGSVADPAGYIAGSIAIQARKPKGRGDGRGERIEANLLANVITGSKGSDVIIGGLGADLMKGRSGDDRYVWLSSAESGVAPGSRDVITDFQAGKDGNPKDQLKLRALAPGLAYIGAQSFPATGAEVRFQAGLLEADSNGYGLADFSVALQRHGDPVAKLWESNLLL